MTLFEKSRLLPKKVMFSDAGYTEWNQFPLGFGIEGKVSWDVRRDPSGLLITGLPGTGKTVMAANLIQHANDNADQWNVVFLNPKGYSHWAPNVDGVKNEKYFSDFAQCTNMLKTINNHMQLRSEKIDAVEGENYIDSFRGTHSIIVVIDSADELFIETDHDTDKDKEMKRQNLMNLWSISRMGRTTNVCVAVMSQNVGRRSNVYKDLLVGYHIDFTKPESLTDAEWPLGRAQLDYHGPKDVIQTYSQPMTDRKEIFD